jgi:DNA repair protein RecN (Recombination protein N)
VVKNQLENDTTSQVNPLNKEQRVDEIARLLSGTKVTEAAKNQAKVLLNPL